MHKIIISMTEKNKSRSVYQWVDSKKLRALNTIHGPKNITIVISTKTPAKGGSIEVL